MVDNIAILRKAISEDNLAPIYLLKGEELFLINAAYNLIRGIVPKEDEELCFSEFYPPMNIKDALELAGNCSFFGRRVVVIRDYVTLNATELAAITEYCKKPCSDTVLLLMNTELKLKSPNIAEYVFYKLKDYEIKKMLVARIKEMGLTAQASALDLLIKYKCLDLSLIMNEILKLKAYCYPNTNITLEAVKSVVDEEVSNKIFDLTNALSHKNIALAYRILYGIDMSPEDVAGALTEYFLILYYVIDSGASNEELSVIFGKKKYYVSKISEGACNFTAARVREILTLLYDLEFSFRGREISANSYINRAMVGISK